jgi:hypothetical protein
MTNDFSFSASRRKFVNILVAAGGTLPLTAAFGQGANLSKMKAVKAARWAHCSQSWAIR